VESLSQLVAVEVARTGWKLEAWEREVLARGGKLTLPNNMTISLSPDERLHGRVVLMKSFTHRAQA
jgi:hypothetical protein